MPKRRNTTFIMAATAVENCYGALKMTDMKLQDMKKADKIAGHQNARQEIAGRENAGHEIARHLELCTSPLKIRKL